MATSGPLERAVLAAARKAALDDRDKAALLLARKYARDLDEDEFGADLDKLGPKLLSTLDALGMTKRGRAAMNRGAPNDKPTTDPIDELRSRRAARQHNPEALDATAT